MGGKRSRTKGARGEREAAAAWVAAGLGDAERSARNGVRGASDLLCPGLHLEVKRYARLHAESFMQQAEESAMGTGGLPIVLMRCDRGDWLFMCRLDQLSAVARTVELEATDASLDDRDQG